MAEGGGETRGKGADETSREVGGRRGEEGEGSLHFLKKGV